MSHWGVFHFRTGRSKSGGAMPLSLKSWGANYGPLPPSTTHVGNTAPRLYMLWGNMAYIIWEENNKGNRSDSLTPVQSECTIVVSASLS